MVLRPTLNILEIDQGKTQLPRHELNHVVEIPESRPIRKRTRGGPSFVSMGESLTV